MKEKEEILAKIEEQSKEKRNNILITIWDDCKEYLERENIIDMTISIQYSIL